MREGQAETDAITAITAAAAAAATTRQGIQGREKDMEGGRERGEGGREDVPGGCPPRACGSAAPSTPLRSTCAGGLEGGEGREGGKGGGKREGE